MTLRKLCNLAAPCFAIGLTLSDVVGDLIGVGSDHAHLIVSWLVSSCICIAWMTSGEGRP